MSDVPATTTRQIDTVIFDLGGVLMRNGRQSDVVRRFPPDKADAALRVFMGEYGEDNDHPWHRLERGEHRLTLSKLGTLLDRLKLRMKDVFPAEF